MRYNYYYSRCLMIAASVIIAESPLIAETIKSRNNDSQTIGIINFISSTHQLDRRAKRDLDALALKIKKLSLDKSIKIEGFSSIGANKEEAVKNSLVLAREVATYLQMRHNINAESLFVSASADKISNNGKNIVRISYFTKTYNFEQVEIQRNLTDKYK